MSHQITITIFQQRMGPEDSDIEQEMIIEQQEEYDSDESVEDEPVSQNVSSIWTAKDEIEWGSNPLPSAQTRSRNILRQRGGPAVTSNMFAPDELSKSIMGPEIRASYYEKQVERAKECEMLSTMIC